MDCTQQRRDGLRLDGKTALVGGASQGIGAATARELARLGARVIAYARSEDKLKDLTESLEGAGHRFFAVDIADQKALQAYLEDALKAGPIEIAVCNSGGPKAGPIAAAADDEFLQSFHNHVLVNAMIVRQLLPGMKELGYGRVINVISTSVKIPIPNLGVSNTIRGAVASWAKTLSLEVAPFGITVNNVLPGYTETPRLEALISGAAKKADCSYEEMREVWKERVPAKRFAQPAETAAAVAFLAGPMAGYINGVSLPVDGGRTGCL